jgi:penicillin-binding protein 1A
MNEGSTIWQRAGRNVEDLPDPFAPIPAEPAAADQPRPRRRWRYVVYGLTALILATLLWLVITAPLGRALEPLEDPAMLLLSEEGRPRSPSSTR